VPSQRHKMRIIYVNDRLLHTVQFWECMPIVDFVACALYSVIFHDVFYCSSCVSFIVIFCEFVRLGTILRSCFCLQQPHYLLYSLIYFTTAVSTGLFCIYGLIGHSSLIYQLPNEDTWWRTDVLWILKKSVTSVGSLFV
jgi:hypothetical protein